MPIQVRKYEEILNEVKNRATLVAVSKTKPPEDIKALYERGQRDFGENYVQEMVDKQAKLPQDIHWHFIGHLQSNKVKQIASFVSLIQGVDSVKLLTEINKQALKNNRIINCLLQVHISKEETKFGFNEMELMKALDSPELLTLTNIRVCGLMGMASFTDDLDRIRGEYKFLKSLFDRIALQLGHIAQFSILSMGMSQDYTIALENGSTMIRIGSLIFGQRV
jgi:pyridoxal phosphate enzyme (YggS family)